MPFVPDGSFLAEHNHVFRRALHARVFGTWIDVYVKVISNFQAVRYFVLTEVRHQPLEAANVAFPVRPTSRQVEAVKKVVPEFSRWNYQLAINREPGDCKASGVQIANAVYFDIVQSSACLLYTSPSPRDQRGSRMPSSA